MIDYNEALLLIRKHMKPGDTLGKMFMRVAKALEEPKGKRDDLAKMLTAWHFWGELDSELQSELLDCIEHTYSGFRNPRALEEPDWLPIETKPPWVSCENRGLYTHDGDGLFYFKATHWRSLRDDLSANIS